MFESSKNANQNLLFIGLLVTLTVLLYGRTLGFDFVWDDLLYVLDSEAYRTFDLEGMLLGLGNGVEYLPVRDLTFALDFRLWGDRPAGFHFSNVLFYTITVILVYLATLRLAPRLCPGIAAALAGRTALMTAIVFALHPLHVEPACFVNGRNTLVAGMFFFLSLLAYLHYLDTTRWRWLLASLVCFALAVFSKAIAIVLPLLLVLIVLFDGARLKPRLAGLAPFFVVALLAFIVFREVAQATFVITPEQAFATSALSPGSRLATALQIPFFYLSRFFLPAGLSVDYAPGFSSSLLSLQAAGSFVALALIASVAVRYRRRFPLGLFALLAYLALLLPVSNLFLTSPVVADRYAFLPVYPLCLLVAGVLALTLRGAWFRTAGALLCLALGLVSFNRSTVWASNEVLWQATLNDSSDSTLALFNLANSYYDQQRYNLALQTMAHFASLNPYSILPEAMSARVALVEGRYVTAIEILEQAISEKAPTNEAYSYLAVAYEATGQAGKALATYRKILQSERTDLRERRAAEARLRVLRPRLMAVFSPELKLLQNDPGNPQQVADLAIRLDAAGLDEEALRLYLKLEEENGAHWAISLNIGTIYSRRGELEKAIANFRASIELNPRNQQALNELGLVLQRKKDYEGAERAFLDAIRLAPDYDKAPFNLAVMYLRLGRKDEARQYFDYTAKRFPALKKRVDAYVLRM